MKDEYNYLTAGYDAFLNRSSSPTDQPSEQLLEDESSLRVPQLSATSLVPGITRSQNGKMIVNWAEEQMIFADGARNRVEIGKIPGTEEYGIRIYDALGNLIFSAEGQLQTEGLTDGSITGVKIANAAISTAKIQDAAITNAKIVDATITNAKIDELSADKITTGTLIASDGTNATKIIVEDALGNDIVTLDTSGITVNTGKLTIKDANETTIIDATGLVSAANFTVGNAVNVTLNQDFTDSDVWTDIDGLSSLTINPTRTVNVLIMAQAIRTMNSVDGTSDFNAFGYLGIKIDDTVSAFSSVTGADRKGSNTDNDGLDYTPLFVFVFAALEAGDHTIKAVGKYKKVSGADAHMVMQKGTIGYVVLGT